MDATSRMFTSLCVISEKAASVMAERPVGCYLYDEDIGTATINIAQSKFIMLASVSLKKLLLTIKDDKLVDFFQVVVYASQTKYWPKYKTANGIERSLLLRMFVKY